MGIVDESMIGSEVDMVGATGIEPMTSTVSR